MKITATITKIGRTIKKGNRRKEKFLVIHTSTGEAYEIHTSIFLGTDRIGANPIDLSAERQVRAALARESQVPGATHEDVTLLATTKPKKIIG